MKPTAYEQMIVRIWESAVTYRTSWKSVAEVLRRAGEPELAAIAESYHEAV